MNPYSDQTFPGFFIELFWRFFAFLSGNLSFQELATDEIQLLVLMGIAASSALVGTYLILRKMTMLANSLSHTILIGIVGAFIMMQGESDLQTMLMAAAGMGIVTSILTEILTKKIQLQEDASTGLVFTSLFAMGIILVTLFTRNAHIGVEAVMGNVDALQPDDCLFVAIILLINLLLVGLFYKEYLLITFDPQLAKALGFSTLFFNYLLITQVSITVVGAFRAVGVLMVLAFITGPALTARLLTHSLGRLLALAMAFGCLASLIGVALSRHILTAYGMALSTSGIVVCTLACQFVLVAYARKLFHIAQSKMLKEVARNPIESRPAGSL